MSAETKVWYFSNSSLILLSPLGGLVCISVCVYLEADLNKDVSAGRLFGWKQQ